MIGIAALVGLDRWLGASLHTQGELRSRVERATLAPDARHVVILGTCLSEQHILLPQLQPALPAGWQVHNLGAAATTPVEWYLAWKNHLPHQRIDALVLAYGRFDLTEPTTPWESETLDLLGAGDLSELIEVSCTTAECGLDLRLQSASALWRYRPILGGVVWHALGLAPPADPKLTRLRVVEGSVRSSADAWDPANPSVAYLERLATQARAAGSTVLFMPLPLRPDPLDAQQQRTHAALDAGVDALVARVGATRMPTPPLDRELFQDEVHLGRDGAVAYTSWLAAELPRHLPAAPAP
ncbi:hypothetical protein L6R53_16785 [Myxococcota bacterium]|nr:hypothetical protein [Myxococcota bacterium]